MKIKQKWTVNLIFYFKLKTVDFKIQSKTFYFTLLIAFSIWTLHLDLEISVYISYGKFLNKPEMSTLKLEQNKN